MSSYVPQATPLYAALDGLDEVFVVTYWNATNNAAYGVPLGKSFQEVTELTWHTPTFWLSREAARAAITEAAHAREAEPNRQDSQP